MHHLEGLQSRIVLRQRVDATSYDDAAARVAAWARAGESRYVCVSNVHMVMEGYDDPAYQRVVNAADLVTPDGVPLVWALRLMGVRDASRVYGPDLTPAVCGRAAQDGIPVGFYGGSPEALGGAVARLTERFPALRVVYRHSPPFRAATAGEDEETVAAINASGARILFVGLGCPKQERWMAEHRGRVGAVMLGVGAAFDFLAGTKRQAPRFLMKIGMEWAFRLATEPRRLGRRYLYHNPRYAACLLRQLASRSPAAAR
ncbi:MAG TPA: WecB/TagA/CpsF family glycosyltransferase [Longimicrobium sp.]|nr:WecB/TagA/CpsF family glycosyltransferase [Longimicrobium sp.]